MAMINIEVRVDFKEALRNLRKIQGDLFTMFSEDFENLESELNILGISTIEDNE